MKVTAKAARRFEPGIESAVWNQAEAQAVRSVAWAGGKPPEWSSKGRL